MNDAHGALTAEEISLLKSRAKKMATLDAAQAEQESIARQSADSYLCLRTFDEKLGLNLECVVEVTPIRNIVTVPNTHQHVIGIVRLRGKVIALVDLRRFWNRDIAGNEDSDLAVIVEYQGIDFGIICSEIEGLLHIAADDILPLPSNLPSNLAASLLGMADRDTKLVDLETLVANPGFVMGQQGARVSP